jgi:hypothetical protein
MDDDEMNADFIFFVSSNSLTFATYTTTFSKNIKEKECLNFAVNTDLKNGLKNANILDAKKLQRGDLKKQEKNGIVARMVGK